ncbi:MAG: serpin family protein [Clostridia bacterium]|nr:serpin family protein [Clostridia bacterium]
MKNKITLSIVSLILASVMLFSLCACTAENSTETEAVQTEGIETKAVPADITENVSSNSVEGKSADEVFKKVHTDFSAELFKRSFEGENTLISPLSVMLALGMTATGAEGNTAAQFTELFGGIEAAELSKYLKGYTESVASRKLNLANSIWLNNKYGFNVKNAFLQGVSDYYAADVFKGISVDAVNKWIEENTDGMIKDMLERLDPTTVMLLVNTVLFKAEWNVKYTDRQVFDDEFTTIDGTKKKVTMMSSSEQSYLENDAATGFLKPYEGGKYAFAALLPKDGTSVDELIATLDGEMIRETLSGVSQEKVITKMPQFEYDFGIEMGKILHEMGLRDAFDPKAADFTGMSDNADEIMLHIGFVLHNTRIELTPVGTKAGAATVVGMMVGSAPMPIEPPKEVYLDRPFVYMIVDTETDLPIFIGAVTDIGE